MRLFRQRVRLDWTEVIGRVEAALREAVSDRRVKKSAGCGGGALRPGSHRLQVEPRVTKARPRNQAWLLPARRRRGWGFCNIARTTIRWAGRWTGTANTCLHLAARTAGQDREAGAGQCRRWVLGSACSAVALAADASDTRVQLLVSEPRPVLQRILGQNLSANGASNVTVLRRLVGCLRGSDAIDETVDGLQLEQLNLLKVGEDADAATVLAGATEYIMAAAAGAVLGCERPNGVGGAGQRVAGRVPAIAAGRMGPRGSIPPTSTGGTTISLVGNPALTLTGIPQGNRSRNRSFTIVPN